MKINYKLIDRDGGVNLAKKKARLGLCENISPKSPDEFPQDVTHRSESIIGNLIDKSILLDFTRY